MLLPACRKPVGECVRTAQGPVARTGPI